MNWTKSIRTFLLSVVCISCGSAAASVSWEYVPIGLIVAGLVAYDAGRK